LKCDITAGA